MTTVRSYFRERVPEEAGKLLDADTTPEVRKRINGEFDALCIFGRRRLAIVYEARQRAGKTINFVIKFLADRFDRSTSTIYRWLAWLKFNGAVERIIEDGQKVTRWLWEYLAGSKDVNTKPSGTPPSRRASSTPKPKIAPQKTAPDVRVDSGPPLSVAEMRAALGFILKGTTPPALPVVDLEERRQRELAKLAAMKRSDEEPPAGLPEAPEPEPTIHPRE